MILLPSGNAIKSVQRGIITIPSGATLTATATITAVDTTKSVMNNLGNNINGTGNILIYGAIVSLTNGTTVTAQRGDNPINDGFISWEVIEFY